MVLKRLNHISKSILTEVIKYKGYRLQKINIVNPLLTNVFKRTYTKKVLMSYILTPFLKQSSFGHTNFHECLTVARLFDKLEYQVDVVDWKESNAIIDYDSYQIIYGLGEALEQSFYSNNPQNTIHIFYGTGIQFNLLSINSVRRVKEFYLRNKVYIPDSARIIANSWPLQYVLSDAIIALGNEYVYETYKSLCPEQSVYKIDSFYYKTPFNIDLNKKNFENSKKHFLWFGSSGLIHKGLDITLEYFIQNPQFTLHICGAQNEAKFFDYYESNYQLKSRENIKNYGFVDIQSEIFEKLLYLCGAIIFPTCCEGGSPSLLNILANGGLFPIVSANCGIDIIEGNILNSLTTISITESIQNFQEISFTELAEISQKIITCYSPLNLEKYTKNIEEIIFEILNIKNGIPH